MSESEKSSRPPAPAKLTPLGNFNTDPEDWKQEWRRLFAEAFGTFWLTFVAAGGDVIGAVSGGAVEHMARVVAPALVVMALIYATGSVSGAHLNPAVTLAFALRKDFPWLRVPGYWVSQIAGAIAAAALLRELFGNVGHLGATLPHHGLIVSLVMEALLTCLLVTVILGTAEAHRIVGSNAALAVGGTISLLGLFASPISGASMNPARSFGPALIGGTLDTYWIYAAGPVMGALLAVAAVWILAGASNHEEKKAAQGSDGIEGNKK